MGNSSLWRCLGLMEEGSERTERLGNDAWMELERKWDSMPGEEVAGRWSSVFRSHPCSALDDGCLEARPPGQSSGSG